jgi:hypothetical protein
VYDEAIEFLPVYISADKTTAIIIPITVTIFLYS